MANRVQIDDRWYDTTFFELFRVIPNLQKPTVCTEGIKFKVLVNHDDPLLRMPESETIFQTPHQICLAAHYGTYVFSGLIVYLEYGMQVGVVFILADGATIARLDQEGVRMEQAVARRQTIATLLGDVPGLD